MKRYKFHYDKFRDVAPRVDPDGEWVRWKEVIEKLDEMTGIDWETFLLDE